MVDKRSSVSILFAYVHFPITRKMHGALWVIALHQVYRYAHQLLLKDNNPSRISSQASFYQYRSVDCPLISGQRIPGRSNLKCTARWPLCSTACHFPRARCRASSGLYRIVGTWTSLCPVSNRCALLWHLFPLVVRKKLLHACSTSLELQLPSPLVHRWLCPQGWQIFIFTPWVALHDQRGAVWLFPFHAH